MGCPSTIHIADNCTFSVCTHDPDTGVLTDADAVPSYLIYEDETGLAILTGNMAKLDDANTTGFYTETVACTTGNGFESGKTYTVYIEAAVDGDTGGISYAFKAETNVLDIVLADLVDNSLNIGEDMTLRKIARGLFNRFFREVTQTAVNQTVKNDAGTDVANMATSDAAGTQTKGTAT